MLHRNRKGITRHYRCTNQCSNLNCTSVSKILTLSMVVPRSKSTACSPAPAVSAIGKALRASTANYILSTMKFFLRADRNNSMKYRVADYRTMGYKYEIYAETALEKGMRMRERKEVEVISFSRELSKRRFHLILAKSAAAQYWIVMHTREAVIARFQNATVLCIRGRKYLCTVILFIFRRARKRYAKNFK